MLKTYRIIPVVFILFLFGLTLITVAPVLAQSTQENESRISALEKLLCSLHPEACEAERVKTDSARMEKEYRDSAKEEREKGESRLSVCMEKFPSNDMERDRCFIQGGLDNELRDKDPYTYAPDGNARQSPDGKFRCIGYPEIRENPDEPRGVAYAKCKQKFDEAKKRK